MSSNSTRKTKQSQRCSICCNTGHNRSTWPHGLQVLQELHSQGSYTFADDQNADYALNSENTDVVMSSYLLITDIVTITYACT